MNWEEVDKERELIDWLLQFGDERFAFFMTARIKIGISIPDAYLDWLDNSLKRRESAKSENDEPMPPMPA